jgi:hypothetical protein
VNENQHEIFFDSLSLPNNPSFPFLSSTTHFSTAEKWAKVAAWRGARGAVRIAAMNSRSPVAYLVLKNNERPTKGTAHSRYGFYLFVDYLERCFIGRENNHSPTFKALPEVIRGSDVFCELLRKSNLSERLGESGEGGF